MTEKLTNRFDSVQLVKEVSKILGGKGGGGRKDFAQAGGQNLDALKDVYDFLQKKMKTNKNNPNNEKQTKNQQQKEAIQKP